MSGPRGGVITTATLRDATTWAEVVGRLGLSGLVRHGLRHSAATAMLSNGVPLKVVSEILGHASIVITADIYGHVSPDVSREALATLSASLLA